MENQRNLYRVTYTNSKDGRVNYFKVVAASEEMAELYCRIWRRRFDIALVAKISEITVEAPFGVRQVFWNY